MYLYCNISWPSPVIKDSYSDKQLYIDIHILGLVNKSNIFRIVLSEILTY